MFTEYTGNRQFDLQLNRTFAPILDRPGMDKVAATTLPRLRSTEQITRLAQQLADRFESEGDADAAWRLYELAAFYLGADDPRKHRFIDAMSRSFADDRRGREADTLPPAKARILLALALSETKERAKIRRMFHEY